MLDDAFCITYATHVLWFQHLQCDLAEWGIVIDNEEEVKKIKADYFDPVWKNSFTGEDVDVQKVMDGLKVNRDGKSKLFHNAQNEQAAAMMPHGHGEYYDMEDTAVEVEDGEKPVVGENEDGAETAASKDGEEAVPESSPLEGDAAAGSVAPSESKDQVSPSSSDVNKTKSGESEEKKTEEYDEEDPAVTKVESQDCSQLSKLQVDCNWCGMGEALKMNRGDE